MYDQVRVNVRYQGGEVLRSRKKACKKHERGAAGRRVISRLSHSPSPKIKTNDTGRRQSLVRRR